MTWRILAVVTAAAIWAGIVPAASVENALVGTWQLKSFSLVVVDTNETTIVPGRVLLSQRRRRADYEDVHREGTAMKLEAR